MKLNCKPGELAFIVRSRSGNEGLIVTVHAEHADHGDGWEWMTESSHPAPCVWIETLKPAPPDKFAYVLDADLRPIRDNDGEDESLTWKDVPHKEHA